MAIVPELPEVETIRRQLSKELIGYRVTNVTSVWEKAFRPSFALVKKSVTGRVISKVDRQAKLIILELSLLSPGHVRKSVKLANPGETRYLLFHLKMTGRLLIRKTSDLRDDYVRSVFSLKMGQRTRELRFADARKFGFIKLLTSKDDLLSLKQDYGPEPLKDLDLQCFTRILKSDRRPIKITLLDQKKISRR